MRALRQTAEMTTTRAALLVHQLDLARALLEHHLQGLGDEECLWEPSPVAWSVRPDGLGGWTVDFADTEPDPVPTPTIAWLMWHIGFWWTTTAEHCFGTRAPAPEEVVWPGGAQEAAAWLRSLHEGWRERVLALTDAELDSRARSAGLFGLDETLGNVAAWVNVELVKNVAEIGSLRLLHAARRAASTPPSPPAG